MTLKSFFLDMVTDDDHRVSSARFLNVVVGLGATLFLTVLAFSKLLTVDFFIAYLAYGSGTFGMGKFLDNRNAAKEAK